MASSSEASRQPGFREQITNLVNNSPLFGGRTRLPPAGNVASTVAIVPPSMHGSPTNNPAAQMLITPPESNQSSHAQLPPVDAPPALSPLLFAFNSPQLGSSLAPSPVLETSSIPSRVYYRHLSTKGRGIPLWIPEPSENLHVEYRRTGLSIGDVIILTPFGGFELLFNICQHVEHPVNDGWAPDEFTPLAPALRPRDVHVYEEFRENSAVTSGGVTETFGGLGPSGILFQSSAHEGAILVMPNGAHSQELTNTASFKRYTEKNIAEWYRYAQETRGWTLKNGDLRVVIGVDKASAWGMATFSNRSSQSSSEERRSGVQLQFKTIDNVESGERYRWEYEALSDCTPRVGPSQRQVNALIPVEANEAGQPERNPEFRNQCLFVRTLNAMLPEPLWEKMQFSQMLTEIASDFNGSSRVQDERLMSNAIPSISGRHSISEFRFSPSQNAATRSDVPSFSDLHPSTAINEFLLIKYPRARLAISDDSDWISVLRATDNTLPSGEEVLRRLQISHDAVEEYGIVRWRVKQTNAPEPSNPSVPRRRTQSLEDLPVYIPQSRSSTTPHGQMEMEVRPPRYRFSPGSKSEDNVLVESPDETGPTRHEFPFGGMERLRKILEALPRAAPKSAHRTQRDGVSRETLL